MKHTKVGYDIVKRILANLDKCSKNGDSNVVRSPWGVFTMYKSNARGRFYSVKESTILHNGGSYKMSTFRRLLASI